MRNRGALKRDILPTFGSMPIDAIARSDLIRWRDGCCGTREPSFNRALPVLSAMLGYAEKLGYRPKHSNPCRGIARFKRAPKERFLSSDEYRRLAIALRAADVTTPHHAAALLLLVYTGARVREITDLRWEWIDGCRVWLPDSKTGPKTIWMNQQSRDTLASIPRHQGNPQVFLNTRGNRPIDLQQLWQKFRRRCALPDVRIHDLRHSFASIAIREGVPLATIGALLSHKLPETTARYAHLADDTIAAAASRVSGNLASALGLAA